MIALDIALFRTLYSFGAAHPILAAFLGRDLIFMMGGLAALFLFQARPSITPPDTEGEQTGRRMLARYIIGSVAAAYLVKILIGLFRFRNRPFAILENVHPLIGNPLTAEAFPSGHATIAFALATAIFLMDKKWGTVMLALAGLVAVGRVIAGVHFPIDVLSGAILGSATAIVFHALQRQIINHK